MARDSLTEHERRRQGAQSRQQALCVLLQAVKLPCLQAAKINGLRKPFTDGVKSLLSSWICVGQG